MIGTTKVHFTGVHGQHLAGLLTLPTEHPAGFALFAHCFTCGKDSHAAARISRSLAERGYGVLRFDVTGLGESEGDFADVTFSCDVSDLALAADHLRTRHRAPDLLVGHSLGGAAVIAAAHLVPEARAVVTIGAPSDPAHVVDLFAGSLQELADTGSAAVTLGTRTFTIRREFVDDIREQPQAQRVTAGRHVLTADEPQSVGGDDSGPTPYDLLLASLGACTAMTLRMYADRKGLPLESVEVTLRHARIHADDCASCATTTGMVDHIDRALKIRGDGLAEADIARLLEIADRCPVHRTLTGQVHVDTRLETAPPQ